MHAANICVPRVDRDPWTRVSSVEVRDDRADIELDTPWAGLPRTLWTTPSKLAVFADDNDGWRWLASIDLPDGYDGTFASATRCGRQIFVTVPQLKMSSLGSFQPHVESERSSIAA
jgi:hypothetical protein